MRIGVFGGSGFVGAAIAKALRELGHTPVLLTAPRLQTEARTIEALLWEATEVADKLNLSAGMRHMGAVINAAGIARPDSDISDALIGANALLPVVLALQAERAGVPRLVHVSSAAVHGSTALLDEKADTQAKSPYAVSKALGDEALGRLELSSEIVIYRPTSVHGAERALTRSLIRFAKSPFSTVAGRGERPTPQALVGNVAAAASFLAETSVPPSHPVIHPWEGMTTCTVLKALSGKEPKHIPEWVASAFLQMARAVGRLNPKAGAQARRLEMLWFGQQQTNCWLTDAGYNPVIGWVDQVWT